MNIDFIQNYCEQLPGVTTDIKWGYDLVFSVGEKMFCVCSTEPPLKVSLKVNDEEFDEICIRDGFQPAPYLARAKWVLIDKPGILNKQEWESFLKRSYDLVTAKLPRKIQEKVRGTGFKAQGLRDKKVPRQKTQRKTQRAKSKKG
jgi:predicted DNA-binding protein (MmcQ/YjbR family)